MPFDLAAAIYDLPGHGGTVTVPEGVHDCPETAPVTTADVLLDIPPCATIRQPDDRPLILGRAPRFRVRNNGTITRMGLVPATWEGHTFKLNTADDASDFTLYGDGRIVDTGGVAVYSIWPRTTVRDVTLDNVGSDNLAVPEEWPDNLRFDCSGVYLNEATDARITDVRFLNLRAAALRADAGADRYLFSRCHIIGSVSTPMRNGVYDLGSRHAKIVDNYFGNCDTEHLQLNGRHMLVARNTIWNDAYYYGSVAAHLAGVGPYRLNDNDLDCRNIHFSLKVGRDVPVQTGVSLSRNRVDAGPTQHRGLIEVAGAVHGLRSDHNRYLGNVAIVNEAVANVDDWAFDGDTWDGFDAPTGEILSVGNATLSNVVFRNVRAAALLSRRNTFNRQVTLDRCRLEGTNALGSIVHGQDAGMGPGAGDGWRLIENRGFNFMPLTAHIGNGETLRINPPMRSGEYLFGLPHDDTIDLAAVQPSDGAVGSGLPLAVVATVTLRAGNNRHTVEVLLDKSDGASTIKMRTLGSPSSSLTTEADWTDAGAAPNLAVLRFRNRSGADIRGAADIRPLVR